MSPPLLLTLRLGLLAVCIATSSPLSLGAEHAWRYRLLHPSELLDACPVCGRPDIPQPMRGTFDLLAAKPTPDPGVYVITNLHFQSALFSGAPVTITGHGSLELRTSPPARAMTLQLRFSHSASNYVAVVDDTLPSVERPWPSLQVSLVETQSALPTQTFHLTLVAAPVRELWFSTAHGMTAALPGPGTRRVTGDDFLSEDGRVLRTGTELLANVGLPPDTLAPALDALLIGPNGEAMFSLAHDATSQTLGAISSGDLLSEHGRIAQRNHELLGNIGFMPPTPDLGLTAVQDQGTNPSLLAIRDSAFSENLGTLVGPADILCNTGAVVRTLKDLTAAFKPLNLTDVVVDAFHVWPSGEVWFSTSPGFTSETGSIGPGDLLSDQGYIVIKNLDLVRAFGPLEDLADFGLDSIQVVSDAIPAQAAPRLGAPARQADPPAVVLSWQAAGQAFQVEAADDPQGPWLPASPVLGAPAWLDPTPAVNRARFYRLRQW